MRHALKACQECYTGIHEWFIWFLVAVLVLVPSFSLLRIIAFPCAYRADYFSWRGIRRGDSSGNIRAEKDLYGAHQRRDWPRVARQSYTTGASPPKYRGGTTFTENHSLAYVEGVEHDECMVGNAERDR